MPSAPVPTRPAGASRKPSSTRLPPQRPGTNRAQTATPTLAGRISPTESLSSKARTPKRKAVSELPDSDVGEETNINVVVRCRGRSDREVRENSGVVVSTDGTKGKKVDLSMGPNALSNKTYSFDKVFSPAADQGIIFDDVVAPILDEVLSGFNCTIFAYGQTGTGKTYTMSGDITDVSPIPDSAGIIPRVLHTLFDKLGDDGVEKSENGVKCSFIELYNEELRDLLAADDNAKLKIYDEANKLGRTTTLVQGMEETFIKSASKGIQLLREGSYRRQVAATKCNDLSSRSHTVFTVTVYMKRSSETGEDFMCSGKLNLVDLAGSENIQRSGAENKRAAEAGLINKSLLTLGRVINALVEKSSHIPYRESKLTRLLQDSLGGRTKTCIIATLSPAKSNLEETISTLDYAFRAKNIRNKPQVNQMVSKKTLLREFTAEIEKLKSELIATRQRNGVYLTSENYEEITTESESRRILSEEQRDVIATLETNLRNKGQELFALTTNFQSLKRDSEQTRMMLDGTKNVLEKTEIILAHTQRSLSQETQLRKAHEETEQQLTAVGESLLGTLGTTTDHVDRLRSKLKRRSDLQSFNRTKWADSQSQVAGATDVVEERIEALRGQQEDLIGALSRRMQSFVSDELSELQSSQVFLQEKATAFRQFESEVNAQTGQAKDNMNEVLAEIKTVREDVKFKVGAGLNDLSGVARRISAEMATELDAFHKQLQDSYVSLGREFKTIFEDMIKRMNEQQTEAQKLREQITQANATFVSAGQSSHAQLQQAVEQERKSAAAERVALLANITNLINDSAASQEARMSGYIESASKRIKTSEDEYSISQQSYGSGMDSWNNEAQALVDSCVKSREAIKSKLKADWGMANERTTKLTETTNVVHDETIRIVDGQMAQMDSNLVALDEIVSRVRAQNEEHHNAHTQSLGQLASNVQESYANIGEHFETSYARTKTLESDVQSRATALVQTLPMLEAEGDIRRPLQTLREDTAAAQMAEYEVTGNTPAKTRYAYPTSLPRTESHDKILDRILGGGGSSSSSSSERTARSRSPQKSPAKRSSPLKSRNSPSKATPSSPSKTPVFADMPQQPFGLPVSAPPARPQTASSLPSLRELDVNIGAGSGTGNEEVVGSTAPGDTSKGRPNSAASSLSMPLPLKKVNANPLSASLQVHYPTNSDTKLTKKPRGARMTVAGLAATAAAEGEENMPPQSLSASVGPGGRWLRSRGSD